MKLEILDSRFNNSWDIIREPRVGKKTTSRKGIIKQNIFTTLWEKRNIVPYWSHGNILGHTVGLYRNSASTKLDIQLKQLGSRFINPPESLSTACSYCVSCKRKFLRPYIAALKKDDINKYSYAIDPQYMIGVIYLYASKDIKKIIETGKGEIIYGCSKKDRQRRDHREGLPFEGRIFNREDAPDPKFIVVGQIANDVINIFKRNTLSNFVREQALYTYPNSKFIEIVNRNEFPPIEFNAHAGKRHPNGKIFTIEDKKTYWGYMINEIIQQYME